VGLDMQQGLLSAFNPSDALMPPAQQGYRGLLSRMEQNDKGGLGVTPYQVSAFGSAFLPSAGISDVLGFAPDPNVVGGTLPSFSENIDQGNYIDAGLQTLGASGDVMLASAPFAPFLLAPAVGAKLISQVGKGFRGASKVAPETGLLGKANEIIPDNGLLGKVDNVQPQTGIAEVVPPTDKADGIFAFHGSGADFDEFKLSKIGTGEGNQAFGYGLYFTDSEDIAKFYKNAMSQKGTEGLTKTVDYKGKKINIDNIETNEEFFQPKLDAINKVIDNLSEIKIVDSAKTYEVKINAVMDDLIDYDKSLGQQSDNIKNILNKMKSEVTVDDAVNLGFDPFDFAGSQKKAIQETIKSLFGKDEDVVRFLNNWSAIRGEQATGEKLLAKYGAKGIKYKADQGVGARNVPETGKNNYVIFDDKIIDIMKKYGIVGAVGVTAMQGRGNQSSEADLSL
jgi:hypothetical protein